MINNQTSFQLYLSLTLLLVMAACMVSGCQEEQKPAITSDALANARLMPETMQIVTNGTTSIISVTGSSVNADFPNSLTFNLQAVSNYPINDVQLLYTTHRVLRPSVTVTIKPVFEPGSRIDVDWEWDTRKASLPPGAQIEYQWKITNEASDTLETETYS